ncbi:hypothetical protein LIER_03151 [Lithospermum erythrorhizon]|uniref:Uncharacterized protein n=1 Tax=Lithospermum erythrorhizon TaxID=34254 RepID=A0AAV3NTT1_LITER
MLIKSRESVDHEASLRESFDNLQSVGDRSLPFFKAIKKGREFEWTLEYEKSFQEFKAYLQSPQLLVRPVAGDVCNSIWQFLIQCLVVCSSGRRKRFRGLCTVLTGS